MCKETSVGLDYGNRYNMKIPQRLSYVLERDQRMDGLVKSAISEFEPWISNSTLPFFSEYTNHGIPHIESVLKTSVSLIHDNAWSAFTANDAAVLILGVLLHDSAMHVTEEGFLSLFDKDRSEKLISGIDVKKWDVLWEDYFSEATRYDGQKLVRIFGDATPVRRPPKDSSQMTKRDRLVITEFLRRYHHRLAHEIALFGVPSAGKNSLILRTFTAEDSYIPMLAGLVARSHGEEIRKFLPYLKEHYDVRQFKNVHPVFLMAVLRVADYLQIDAERAPSQVLQVKSLASPVSQGEWRAHQAIRDVKNTTEDPEALYIDALPTDVATFFKIQSWVKGIQYELDAAWAVMGEVYGRYEGLKNFGLLLRRVQSSLDDIKSFSKKIDYHPQEAKFRAADADLLKLLIEPLYGSNPEIGLRELIQNSVDAVRELKQYLKDVSGVGAIQQNDQDADVMVALEKIDGDSEHSYVRVSDKGIGMSVDIIVNYFLAAGASFRRSEDWRKRFENEEGSSKVLRAGRFGVGALASFLLGPEIEVVTRHVEDEIGIRFTASVDSEHVELKKIDCPVGTTILIKVSKHVAEKLVNPYHYYYPDNTEGRLGYWYFLPNPSLKRVSCGTEFKSEVIIPDIGDSLSPEWRKTVHQDYAGILWTYFSVWSKWGSSTSLFCNGIKIYKHRQSSHSGWDKEFWINYPNISVFDPDGALPLNLQRTALAAPDFPFADKLIDDIFRDFAAYALVYGPNVRPEKFNAKSSIMSLGYRGSARASGYYYSKKAHDWYFTDKGFGYLSPEAFVEKKYPSALLVQLLGENSGNILIESAVNEPVILAEAPSVLTELDSTIRSLLELGCYAGNTNVEASNSAIRSMGYFPRVGLRLLLSRKAFDRANLKGNRKLTKGLKEALKIEWEIDGWCLVKIGKCPGVKFNFKEFVGRNKPLHEQSIVSEIYFEYVGRLEKSPAGERWKKVMKTFEIPFDINLRKETFASAYSELAPEINAHEKIKKLDEQERQKQLDATNAINNGGSPGH